MNKSSFLKASVFLLVCICLSCKNEKPKDQVGANPESATPKTQQSTYAELSIKQGGHWEGRKYIGGDKFENVSDFVVPKEHTDHSFDIRYEGPGWENKYIGYRLYLDWRNAIDIFGKKVDTMVLQQVGQDGFDSYHELSDWGMDVLKAGKSLGIGGYGRQVADSIAHFREVEKTTAQIKNTESESSVTVNYQGWKAGPDVLDLVSTITIFPDPRYSQVNLQPSESISGLATGIVIHDDIIFFEHKGTNWSYIATYGNQSLSGDEDQLGLAIFYKNEEVEEVKDGEFDHLVIFKPTETSITYYLMGTWSLEKYALGSEDEFKAYLDQELQNLESE